MVKQCVKVSQNRANMDALNITSKNHLSFPIIKNNKNLCNEIQKKVKMKSY